MLPQESISGQYHTPNIERRKIMIRISQNNFMYSMKQWAAYSDFLPLESCLLSCFFTMCEGIMGVWETACLKFHNQKHWAQTQLGIYNLQIDICFPTLIDEPFIFNTIENKLFQETLIREDIDRLSSLSTPSAQRRNDSLLLQKDIEQKSEWSLTALVMSFYNVHIELLKMQTTLQFFAFFTALWTCKI